MAEIVSHQHSVTTRQRTGWRRWCLFVLTVCAALAFSQSAQAQSTGTEQDQLKRLQEKLRSAYEQTELSDRINTERYIAFDLMKRSRYLPAGTRFTSGFRSAADQIRVIRQEAERYNSQVPNDRIPVPPPNASPQAPGTWQESLSALQARGYFISSPLSATHNTEEMVFDLTGPSLDEIFSGCLRADKEGIIILKKTPLKEEVNKAVHVELRGFGPKGLRLLGTNSVQLPAGSTPAASASPGAAEKQALLLHLTNQHLSETDPREKIKIDRQKLTIALQSGDTAYAGNLEAEIRQHEQEVNDQEKISLENQQEARKQETLKQISKARSEGNSDQAIHLAESFEKEYQGKPEANGLVAQVKIPYLYEQAIDLIFDSGWDCDECNKAKEKVEAALSLLETLPANQKSQFSDVDKLNHELAAHLSNCTARWILKIIGLSLLAVFVAVALVFVFRSGYLTLECVDGEQQGESFPLIQTETIVGSLGEPDGAAQIVINDRKHKISRSHCVIKRSGRRFYLKDISANGTTVNGKPMEQDEYHELQKGDEISLADAATLIVRRK